MDRRSSSSSEWMKIETRAKASLTGRILLAGYNEDEAFTLVGSERRQLNPFIGVMC